MVFRLLENEFESQGTNTRQFTYAPRFLSSSLSRREITHFRPRERFCWKPIPQQKGEGEETMLSVIKVASWKCCQTSAKVLVKELIFSKAASPVALTVNDLTTIFYEFLLEFFVHLCSKAEYFLFRSLLSGYFLFLFILFPWKAFTINFLTNIC